MFSSNYGKRVLNRLSKTVLLQGAVLFFLLYGGRSVLSATNEMTGDSLAHVGKVNLPHGYSAGEFVRKGNYLFLTHGESGRTLEVIDVSDHKNPRSVAFATHGLARLFRPYLQEDLLVCIDTVNNLVPFDVSEPKHPRKLPYWHPGLNQPRLFLKGKYLFLAGKTEKKAPYYHFRVYEVDKPFRPRLIASADLLAHVSEKLKERIKEKGVCPDNTVGIYADDNLLHVAFGSVLFGIDVSKPDAPQVVYEYDVPEVIMGVAVKGKTVFLSLQLPKKTPADKEPPQGQAGVAALDISDVKNIRRIGTLSEVLNPRCLLLAGEKLYVSARELTTKEERMFKGREITWGRQERTVLKVVDVSNPAGMKTIGSWRCRLASDAISDMMPDGKNLLVGVNLDGFYVLDVANSSAVKEVAYLADIGGEAGGIVLSGNYAYLMTDRYSPHNLHTVDISDPANPKLVHSLYVPGALSTGTWSPTVGRPDTPYKFLYLVGGWLKEIVIVNIEKPSRPEVEDVVPFKDGWHFEQAPHVFDAGERIYLAAVRFEKEAWQCALISFLKKDGGRSLEWESATILPGVTGVGVKPGIVQLCIEDKTCYVVSHEPSQTTDFITTQIRFHEPPVRNRMPMVTLTTVDISNPEGPRVLAAQSLHQAKTYLMFYNRNIICRNKRLYIHGEGGVPREGPIPQMLYIYDVSDPAKPVFLSSLHDATAIHWYQSVYDIALLDPYPLLTTQNYIEGLTLIDVRDPLNPSVLWREPADRDQDEEETELGYRRHGFSAGVFRNGCLYVPRISHLDIFKLNPVPAESVTPEARRARIEKTLEKSLVFEPRNGAEKGALLIRRKAMMYHLARNDLAYAEGYRNSLEQLMKDGLALAEPALVSLCAKSPIKLDGKPDEWGDVPAFEFGYGKVKVKSQWDNEYLYFFFEINDDVYDPATKEEGIWAGDGVEIFLNPSLTPGLRSYGSTDYQYIFAPNGLSYIHSNNPRFLNSSSPVFSYSADRRTEKGYTMEIAVSALETWFFPARGSRLAWMCSVNDRAEGVYRGSSALVEGGYDLATHLVAPQWLQMELK